MSWNKTINFDLAGLDLIVTPQGQIYFIEANSFPGFFQEQIGQNSQFLKKTLGKNLTILLPEGLELTERYTNLLKSLTNFKIIYIQNNQIPLIKPDTSSTKIMAWKSEWKPLLSKKHYVINSPEISILTKDKYQTYQVMQKAKIKMPQTFLVNSFSDIKKIFKQTGLTKLVIKPRFGFRGEDIHVLDQKQLNYAKKSKIDFKTKEYIAQEFINTSNEQNLFYDYRILVVGGKYIGAIKRESSNPVVNISLGGIIKPIDLKMSKKLATVSEKIVATIIEFSSQKGFLKGRNSTA